MRVRLLVVYVVEGDVESAGEVLAHVVTRPGLKRLAVAHHGLDGVRNLGPGKTFAGGFFTLKDRQRAPRFSKIGVDVDHLRGFGEGFVGVGVSGVALLPQKLGGPQKGAGSQLPAHHVRPLVVQKGQVAVRLHPLAVHLADDRFRSRTDGQGFLELFAPGVRDHRELRRKALDVARFTLEKAHRNQQWKVQVFVSGRLEHIV